MSKHQLPPPTTVTVEVLKLLPELISNEYSVLVGPNNSGKSFILRQLALDHGPDACYIGPQRYQNLVQLGVPQSYNPANPHNNLRDVMNSSQTADDIGFSLAQMLSRLSNSKRATLFEIMKTVLATDMRLEHLDHENVLSPQYVAADGHNLSFTSSGFRLVLGLMTALIEEHHQRYIIDEPEIGLSPETQVLVSEFLFDRDARKKYFPHIKSLIFATHSSIFLDRQNISNNYQIRRDKHQIHLERAQSHQDFNRIHFYLLGNRFETLYLPSAIILVEGKTDRLFIERVLALRFPNHKLSLVAANSDDQVKNKLHLVKEMLGDFPTSPYRERVIIVLDATHQHGLVAQLSSQGVPTGRIVQWPKNGIEYYYPPKIIDTVYGAGLELSIEGDNVSRNGITYTKNQLVEKVVSHLDSKVVMHPEFEDRFLKLVQQTIAT